MSKKVYDNNIIDIFPKQFSMELPNGYRIDTEYDDEMNQIAHLRGGFYTNDDGEEDFEFTGSFITLNSDVTNRDNMVKEGKLKEQFVPGMMLEQVAESMMENLQEQFGTGKRLNLYNAYPASTIMKFYKPISFFGVTIESYVLFYWVEITENLHFGFNTVYQNKSDGTSGDFYKHLLNVIKSVRVSGKAVDVGNLTPKKLEKALDMDRDDDVEAMDLGLSIGINFQDDDGETRYTINSDGSITSPDGNVIPPYESEEEAEDSLFGLFSSFQELSGPKISEDDSRLVIVDNKWSFRLPKGIDLKFDEAHVDIMGNDSTADYVVKGLKHNGRSFFDFELRQRFEDGISTDVDVLGCRYDNDVNAGSAQQKIIRDADDLFVDIANKPIFFSRSMVMIRVRGDDIRPWDFTAGLYGLDQEMTDRWDEVKDVINEIAESIKLIDGAGKSTKKKKAETVTTDPDFIESNGILRKYIGHDTDIVIPEGVKEIADSTFSGLSNIESVVVPEGVKKIGRRAFENCTNLRTAALPESLEELGGYAFVDCHKLEEVYLSDKLKDLGDSAFSECFVLKDIRIPKKVKRIDAFTFKNCRAFKHIVIPEGVKSIGVSSFVACENLEYLFIPKSVTDIAVDFMDNHAFSGSDKLTIYAPAGSYAQSFAEEKGIPFKTEEKGIVTADNSAAMTRSAKISGAKGKSATRTVKTNQSYSTEEAEALQDAKNALDDIGKALDDIRDHWKATESVRLGLMEYFDKVEAREKKEKAERKKNKKNAAAAGKSDADITNMYVVLCNEEKAKTKGMTSSKFYKLYEDFFPAFTKDELWNARKDMLAKMQDIDLCKEYEDSFRERNVQDRFNIATKSYFGMAMDIFHNSTLCAEDAIENTSAWFNADEMPAVQQLMNNELIRRNNRISEQFSWAEPDWMKYSKAKEYLEIQIDDYNERKELVSDDCKMFQVKLDAAGGPFLVAAVLRQKSFMPLVVNVMDDCTHYWGVSQSEIWEAAFRNNVRNTSDVSFNEKQYAKDAMRIAKSNYPDFNEIKRIRKEESEKKVGKFVRDIKKFCESSDSIKASDVKKALKDAFSNASELADYKEKLVEAASKEKLEFISAILSGQEEAQDLYNSLPESLANEINNIIKEKILAEKDAEYAKAINLSDSNDMKDLIEAKEVFASLGLFKDAKALEKHCVNRIDEIKNAQYDEAITLRDAGTEESIQKAIKILTELGTFNDANEKVKEIKIELDRRHKLEEIKTLSQTDSITNLSKAITMLEDFKGESANAQALIDHCSSKIEKIKDERYAQAISLAEEGTEASIKSAILKMEAINPHRDSESRIKDLQNQLQDERTYMNAASLAEGTVISDLIVAKGLFEKLESYKDSSDRAAACDKHINELCEEIYQEGIAAEKVYSLKSQTEAISKFNQLGTYKDSFERKNQCSENCKTIQAIHDLNKEIEEHKKELAAITGAFKKKERQAKETLIAAKEQRVTELKDKLTGKDEKEKSLTEQKKTEEEMVAEIDVIEKATDTVSPVAASVASSAVTSERSTTVTSSDSKTTSASLEPKKKGKGGVIIAVILVIVVIAVVGWLAMSGRLGSITQSEDAYVEEEVVQEITPEFTAANVLTIEEIGREMYEDGKGIYVHYKVTNTSDSYIWYLGFSNRYYDKSGNILGENGGSYSGTLAPGKFAYITDSPYFEKENYDEIDTIEVTKYYYNIGNQSYDINLRTNELDSYSGAIEDQKNVDYVAADIVSITLGETLTLKDGNYVLDVTATNNGKEPLKSLSIYIEFYDEDGNSLDRESVGGLDMTLEPGKTVKTLGYCWSDYADQAKTFAIVDYEYDLNKKDQNGYNHYTINKNVDCAYGMEW